MPKTASLTVGDLLKKASRIKAAQLLYVLLLVATFLIGYLIARVQIQEPPISHIKNINAGISHSNMFLFRQYE